MIHREQMVYNLPPIAQARGQVPQPLGLATRQVVGALDTQP